MLTFSMLLNLPENDEWIRCIASKARLVVVSWGNPGHKRAKNTAKLRHLSYVGNVANIAPSVEFAAGLCEPPRADVLRSKGGPMGHAQVRTVTSSEFVHNMSAAKRAADFSLYAIYPPSP